MHRKLLAANYDKCLTYPPEMEDRPWCNSGVKVICCKTRVGAQYLGCCSTTLYCATGNHQLCCYGLPDIGPWGPRGVFECDSSKDKMAGTVTLKSSTPDTTTKCNSVVSDGVNYSGGDLKLTTGVQGIAAASAWQCCLRCQATPGCRTWTWNGPRTDKGCWMKGRTGFVAVPAAGLVSGMLL
jgi:hypothetical protein